MAYTPLNPPVATSASSAPSVDRADGATPSADPGFHRVSLHAERRAEFERLFAEFTAWLVDHERQAGASCWSALRADARRKFAAIADSERLGLDLGDVPLLTLLPHEDTPTQRRRGVFCHVLPGITRDLKHWFETAGWTRPEHWPALSRGVFLLVRQCDENPGELWQACDAFCALAGSRGFDSGLLSPVLNALRPDDFFLVNAATRATVNHFAGTSFGPGLQEYPEAQSAARRLIEDLRDVLQAHAPPGMRLQDAFSLFCHWLMDLRLPANAGAQVSVDAGWIAEAVAPAGVPVGAIESPPAPPAAPAPSTPEASGTQASGTAQVDPVHDPDAAELARLCAIAVSRGQLLLHGPPGTSRDALAARVAARLMLGEDGLLERLAFHPGWSYADFIQHADGHGHRHAGRFTAFCRAAAERKGRCVLLIHDLQRADADAVFGEALSLLDQRGIELTLAGGGSLCIPRNLVLLATWDTEPGDTLHGNAFLHRFTGA